MQVCFYDFESSLPQDEGITSRLINNMLQQSKFRIAVIGSGPVEKLMIASVSGIQFKDRIRLV